MNLQHEPFHLVSWASSQEKITKRRDLHRESSRGSILSLQLWINLEHWSKKTIWTIACQASMCFTISQSLLKFIFIESVILSNHLILCHPLLLLPLIFSSIRVFSNESVLHIMGPKYWHFSFSISLSNEYLGFISFRIDWFDHFAVQETLKSLL